MSDLDTAGTATASDTGYVALDDAANPELATNEELYELIAGKNPDGTPLKKQLKKDEMLKLAQKGFGADSTFQEAQQTKAQMKELARMLADPEAVFEIIKKFGHDPDQLMTGRMAKQMLEAMKTPEQIQAEEWKRDAEKFRAQEAKRLQDEQESLITNRAKEIQTDLYTRIEQTLNSAGVPSTKASVAEVGRYLKALVNKAESEGQSLDIKNVKLENIVAHMRNQHKVTFESLFSDDLDEDGILALLDEKLQKRIGAALTKKLSSGNAVSNVIERKASTTPALDKPEKKERALSPEEANELSAERIRKLQAMWDKQNGR